MDDIYHDWYFCCFIQNKQQIFDCNHLNKTTFSFYLESKRKLPNSNCMNSMIKLGSKVETDELFAFIVSLLSKGFVSKSEIGIDLVVIWKY